MLPIFIGWDAREPLAWQVFAHSILRRASQPVALIPLTRASVAGVYTRERGATEATEFSLTRFLVPYLCGYRGVAVFADCDMLCRADLAELLALVPMHAAVAVCQHDYTPRGATKMDGQPQTAYPRKNWSSLMVFNTGHAHCRRLTPTYVNTAPGLALHRFEWTTDDRIGALPLEWNHLVGEYPANPLAKILHYTLGGPWFPAYRDTDHAKDWLAERAAMEGGDG